MSIRKHVAGETLAETKFNGKKATVQWTVKADKNEKSPRYVLTSTFDFSGVSEQELLTLALRPVVIEVQRQWREMAAAKGSTATSVNPFQTVNVKSAIVDATRKQADPKAAATKLLSKMSAEDRKAILAAFQASVKQGQKKSA